MRKTNVRALALVIAMAFALTGCVGSTSRDVTALWPSSAPSAATATATAVPDTSGAQIPTAEPTTDSERQTYADGTWAVYWYLCGSDLESDYGCATQDLSEMFRVTLPENVQVVIETGGASAWQGNSVSADAIGRYLYSGNTLTKISTETDANMGDAATFTDFLRWCNQNYPAERQAVILWNHGGGSLGGVIYDEKYGYDSLSLPELERSFAAAPAVSGKYEIIGFDACLMATIETADAIDSYARYMVASEESEPGCGWEYTGLFSALASNTSMDGAALGKVICDTFYAGCASEGVADMTTLSVVDLTKAGALIDAYRALGDEALLGSVREREAYLSAYGNAARNAENYGGNNEQQGYFDMVDIGDLVKNAGQTLFPKNGGAVLAALADCVRYQIKGQYRSEASGLAGYYSYDGNLNVFSTYSDIADNPGFEYYFEYALNGELSPEGTDYVRKLQSESGETPTSAQPLPSISELGLDGIALSLSGNGHYTLDVGGERAKNIAFVYLDVLLCAAVSPGEVYMIYDLGSNRAVDMSRQSSGVYTDNFDGKATVIHEKPYEAFEYVYMEVIDCKPGEYTLYSSPVMLTRTGSDGYVPNGERYQMIVNYNETTGVYDILGAKKGADSAKKAGMADKDLRQFTPEDIVIPIPRISYETGFESDVWTPLHWPDVSIDGNFSFYAENAEFYDLVFVDGYYRVRFEMVDYAGRRYTSGDGWYRYENDTLIPASASEVNIPYISESR
ncbi:MAG: hypothetical protein LBN43_07370 [Oscillospiraceae bacterium]|jgi:hypothetical protein|nr:hypothetical protein [Oscillospiraceae bacterium]